MTEYRPSERLEPYVERFWSADFNVNARPQLSQHVVPNGFVELIIHVSDEHCRLSRNGLFSPTPDYIIIGLYTTPYEVRFSGLVDVFGIRLKPEAVYNVFGITAAEFHEQYEDMELVLGVPFRALCNELRATDDMARRIALAEGFLSRQLDARRAELTYVNRAAEMIRQSDGFLRVEDLCSRVYISLRQLEREFRQRIGITPKKYIRLARLNAVQRLLEQSGPVDFTRLAFECGYADQAHFIRDFRALTGQAPRIFHRNYTDYIVNVAAPDDATAPWDTNLAGRS